jgi:N-acetylneuraminate synthase
MKKTFNCCVGYSDHSKGIVAATTAVSLGADVIEKHFTLNKNDGALDSKFSSDPNELGSLIKSCNDAKKALGKINYGPTNQEMSSIKKRRSLYFLTTLNKGDVVGQKDIGSFRPALGLEVRNYDKIIGKKLIKKTKYGQPVKKNFFKK